jgi:hypothetical protein
MVMGSLRQKPDRTCRMLSALQTLRHNYISSCSTTGRVPITIIRERKQKGLRFPAALSFLSTALID